MTFYAKMEKVLFKIEAFIITLMMAIMFITVFSQVLTRFFNLPFPDTSDLSLVSFAIMTFLGAGILVYLKDHISIDITTLIKNRRTKKSIELVNHFFMIVIGVLLLMLGFSLLQYAITSGETTMAMRIPLYIPHTAFVIGLIMLIIHTIGDILELLSEKQVDGKTIQSEDR